MININEYLLGKNKKYIQLEYPKFGCDIKTITDLMDYFDIEETEHNSVSKTYANKLVYKVYKKLNWVELEYRDSNNFYIVIIDLSKENESLISYSKEDVENRSYVNFDTAIEITYKVLSVKDNIKKVIDIITNYKKYLKND